MESFNRKHEYLFLGFMTLINCTGCGNNVSLSPKVSRFIASEYLKKFTLNEKVPLGIRQFIKEEQDSTKLITTGTSSFISPFSPENNPKFPLAYFLIPEEDIHLYFTPSLDARVSDQLHMKISGKKHYKFFIHPELENHFAYLRSAYSYIGADMTEFLATPTSNYRSLFVWNKNNLKRKPFIAKVSLDKKTQNELQLTDPETELRRIMANQKFFEQKEKIKSFKTSVDYFPETAGFDIERTYPGQSEKIQGQIIQELPDDLLENTKRWISFAALISHSSGPRPFVMDVIAKSGMTSFSFIDTYMVDQYLSLFEEYSLKQGIHFQPTSFNLLLETSPDLRPSGKWIARNFEHNGNDALAMAKHQTIIEFFMTKGNTSTFNFLEGRSRPVKDFILYYKPQIFDLLINEIAKVDKTLTPEKITELKNKLDSRFLKLVNLYFNTKIASLPNVNDYQKLDPLLNSNMVLDPKMNKKEIKKSSNLMTFISNKKKRKEWLELAPMSEKVTYYLTDHGLYVTELKKIIAFALFSPNEFEDYKAHNKMLSILIDSDNESSQTDCTRAVASIIEEKQNGPHLKK